MNDPDASPRRRRRVAIVAAIAALLALLGWLASRTQPVTTRVEPREDGVREAAVPPALTPAPAAARGSSAGSSESPPAEAPTGTVRVSVRVTVEGDDPPLVQAYSAAKPAGPWVSRDAVVGVAAEIVVPADHVQWMAIVVPGDRRDGYDNASIVLDALRDGMAIDLEIRRARGTIRAFAHDPRGQPVGLVGLELAHVNQPEATRKTTDSHGIVEWTGVPQPAISSDAVHIWKNAPGYADLRCETKVSNSADGTRTGTTDVLVESVAGSLSVAVPDVGSTTWFLEARWSDGSWVDATEVSSTRWVESDPPFERPAEPAFAGEGLPRPGTIRIAGLRPARYRLIVATADGGLAAAEVDLGPGEAVRIDDLRPFPAAKVAGTLVGPAVGELRFAVLHVVRPSVTRRAPAARAVAVWFTRDGHFRLALPVDATRVRVVAPTTDLYVLIPSVETVSTSMRLVSAPPVRVRGRIARKEDGSGWAGRQVDAYWIPSKTESADDSSGTRLGTATTDAEGRFEIPPAPPGTWRLVVSVASGGVTLFDVTVPETASYVLPDVQVTSR